jgi:hypothetical protein
MEWISVKNKLPAINEKVLWTNGEFAWSGCITSDELNEKGLIKYYSIDIDAQWHYQPYQEDFKFWTKLILPK